MNNHYDGQRVKENDYSCICYLNSDYEGGMTMLENEFIETTTGDLIFFNSKNLCLFLFFLSKKCLPQKSPT